MGKKGIVDEWEMRKYEYVRRGRRGKRKREKEDGNRKI